jgi:hypothetical protein
MLARGFSTGTNRAEHSILQSSLFSIIARPYRASRLSWGRFPRDLIGRRRCRAFDPDACERSRLKDADLAQTRQLQQREQQRATSCGGLHYAEPILGRRGAFRRQSCEPGRQRAECFVNRHRSVRLWIGVCCRKCAPGRGEQILHGRRLPRDCIRVVPFLSCTARCDARSGAEPGLLQPLPQQAAPLLDALVVKQRATQLFLGPHFPAVGALRQQRAALQQNEPGGSLEEVAAEIEVLCVLLLQIDQELPCDFRERQLVEWVAVATHDLKQQIERAGKARRG